MINSMASKLSFCVSVVFLSLGLLSVGIAMSISADVDLRPRPPLVNQGCVHFEHHYCNKFGYNSTIALNPWVRDLSLEQAIIEFEDFNSLLLYNCSNKLGIFLCLTYFPLCFDETLGPRQVIPPCKEICDEVHASLCYDIVVYAAGRWPQHLRCSNFQSKSESQNWSCVSSNQDTTGEKENATTTVCPPTTTKGVDKVTSTKKNETETNTGCEGGPNLASCTIIMIASTSELNVYK